MSASHTRSIQIGALLWLLSAQYYIVQIVVAAVWPSSQRYSWAHNTISDLANTYCGPYGERLVCSPRHAMMNASFIIMGITMLSGAFILGKQLARGRAAHLGFACLAVAGAGTILVGLFPENSVSTLHILGAVLPFTLGNLGMIIIGCTMKWPVALRAFSLASGFVGLLALTLFMTSTYLGIGVGGMERLVAYPQSIWMIITGVYLLWGRPSSIQA